MELRAASEGMPATYDIEGRQFIVVPVAAGNGLFAPRFVEAPSTSGGSAAVGGVPAPGVAPGDPAEQQAAARQGGGRGAAGPPGQYVVLALKR